MTYVYILSHYHEYGAQNVVATLDRTTLIGLMKKNWPEIVKWDGSERSYGAAHDSDVAGLEKLLERPDEDLARDDGNDLCKGWGGIQLHVVKLDEVAADV